MKPKPTNQHRHLYLVPSFGGSLTKRAARLLSSLRVTSPAHLAGYHAVEILRLPGCGPRTFRELQALLAARGMRFRTGPVSRQNAVTRPGSL